MAYAKSADSDKSLLRVYTACHSTKYFRKQLHKKQNLGPTNRHCDVRNFKTFTVFHICINYFETVSMGAAIFIINIFKDTLFLLTGVDSI